MTRPRRLQGNLHYWTGWKANIDWADGGNPLNVITTSASLHDSQVAVTMMRITAKRAASLYDLMDAAYDAEWIRAASEDLGHVPIIDANRRRGMTLPGMDAARARRYHERYTAERGNSRLKDEFGFRHLRVRGHAKAHKHLMFAVVAPFADQLVRFFWDVRNADGRKPSHYTGERANRFGRQGRVRLCKAENLALT